MGRVGSIGASNGLGSSGQLSLQQQAYSSLSQGLERVLNNIKTNNINKNVKAMKSEYPLTKGGYFGKPGKSDRVRVITADNPVKEATNFFDKISKGGRIRHGGNAKIAVLADNSIITFRVSTKTSRTGKSPAVDINIKKSKVDSNIKGQKIHFERKD